MNMGEPTDLGLSREDMEGASPETIGSDSAQEVIEDQHRDERQIGEQRQDNYGEISDFLNLAGENSSEVLDEFVALSDKNPGIFEQVRVMGGLARQVPVFMAQTLPTLGYYQNLPPDQQRYATENLPRILAGKLRDTLAASIKYLNNQGPAIVIDSGAPQEMHDKQGPDWFIGRVFYYDFHNLRSNNRLMQQAAFTHVLNYEKSKEIWDTVDLEVALQDPTLRQVLIKNGFDPEKLQSTDPYDQFEVKVFIHNYQEFPELMQEGQIDDSLKALYDNPEFKLREFEGKTVDSWQSMRNTADIIKEWLRFAKTNLGFRDLKFTTMLDISGGEGRSGIPFTYTGVNVNAYDISPRMVGDSMARVEEDRRTGELLSLAKSAGMPVKDPERYGEFNQVTGNFFDFDYEKYKANFPDSPRPQVATIMWHSLGFAGNPEGIHRVLQNAYDILDQPGVLIVEMPNREFGAYKASLQGFAQKFPGYPEGTMIDAPSKTAGSASEEDEQKSTPRYFPTAHEVYDIADRIGFIRDPVEKYYVFHRNDEEELVPVIEENLFVFQKL